MGDHIVYLKPLALSTDREVVAAVKAALDEQVKRFGGCWERHPIGFLPDGCPVALNAGGRVVSVDSAEWGRFAQPFGEEREPADRTILHWMPTAYMEAARAGVRKPDALAVALAEEALRQHEAPEPADDGAWIVTVADLRETRRGKGVGGKGEVMGWGGYEDE